MRAWIWCFLVKIAGVAFPYISSGAELIITGNERRFENKTLQQTKPLPLLLFLGMIEKEFSRFEPLISISSYSENRSIDKGRFPVLHPCFPLRSHPFSPQQTHLFPLQQTALFLFIPSPTKPSDNIINNWNNPIISLFTQSRVSRAGDSFEQEIMCFGSDTGDSFIPAGGESNNADSSIRRIPLIGAGFHHLQLRFDYLINTASLLSIPPQCFHPFDRAFRRN